MYYRGMSCKPVETLHNRVVNILMFGGITDRQVCLAYKDTNFNNFPYERLSKQTGKHEIACFKACERAERHGLIEYGVSLRSGWLTERGEALCL